MSKQSDLVNVAQDAGTSGYVNLTGDTMTGALNITASGSGSAGSLNINATDPFIRFYDSNGATDARKWDIRAIGNSEGFVVRTVNDANTSFATRLAVDPSGRVTMPYQPAFWAVSSTYSASGNYPFTNFTLSTGMFNRGNHLNLTTGVFTAPIAGIYHFNGVWNDTINSTSRKIGRFSLNGSSLGEFAEATDQYADIGASIVISMAANDTMQVTTHPLAFAQCNFSGYLIG